MDIEKVTLINQQQLNKLLLQRINFAFDSLYFRYAMAIDELAKYKEEENRRNGSCRNVKTWADGQKMHFYKVLEEILEAHSEDHPLRAYQKDNIEMNNPGDY